MHINKIVVKGIASFKEKTVFDIEQGKVYLIHGEVGSGKSTFFSESIVWCLKGKTNKGIKTSDIVNDVSVKGFVRLHTDKGVIKRVRTKSGEKIYLDNSEVKQDTIDTLVNMDLDLIMNSVIFAQGMSGFMLMNDTEKKSLVSKITLNFIDDKIRRVMDEHNKISEELHNIENDKERYEREIERIRALIKELKQWLDRVIDVSQLKNIAKQIESLQHDLQDKQTDIAKYSKRLTSLHNDLESHYATEREYGKVLLDAKDYVAMHGTKYRILKMKECPACLSSVDKKTGERLREKYEPILQHNKKVITRYENKLKELDKIIDSVAESIKQVKTKIEDIKEDIYAITIQISKKGEEYKNISRQAKEASELTNRLTKLQKQKEQIESEAENNIKQYRYNRTLLKACDFWIMKLKEYRSNMFMNIMQYLAPVCNGYFNQLSGGKFGVDIQVSLSGKKKITDRFNTRIINEKRKEIDRKRLSGGQKKMLSLAGNFAYVSCMSKFYANDWNLIVFDEIFDSLDDKVRARVLDILIELCNKTKKTIFLITHVNFEHDNIVPVEVIITNNSSVIG